MYHAITAQLPIAEQRGPNMGALPSLHDCSPARIGRIATNDDERRSRWLLPAAAEYTCAKA